MLNLKRKIWVIIGTRPEYIKQLPVYYECLKKIGKKNVLLVNSGQHKNFLNFYSKENKTRFDIQVNNLQSTKSLTKNIKKSIEIFYQLIRKNNPEIVIVQGDTTSSAAFAYAAKLNGVTVIHNEAGLRTFDKKNPYPEELNRKLISSVADIHFAPTKLNKKNLIKEGIIKENIFIVGNPGIDSFLNFLKKKKNKESNKIINFANSKSKKIVFLTAHRREAKGKNIDVWFKTLQFFFNNNKDYLLICPEHPNKYAKKGIKKYLSKLDNFYLTKPLSYSTTCHIINNSSFVITDSGGIQEECATINVPIVICRKLTERQEVLKINIGKLTGFKKENIIKALNWAKEKKNNKYNKKPYGNGNSSKKIAKIIFKFASSL